VVFEFHVIFSVVFGKYLLIVSVRVFVVVGL